MQAKRRKGKPHLPSRCLASSDRASMLGSVRGVFVSIALRRQARSTAAAELGAFEAVSAPAFAAFAADAAEGVAVTVAAAVAWVSIRRLPRLPTQPRALEVNRSAFRSRRSSTKMRPIISTASLAALVWPAACSSAIAPLEMEEPPTSSMTSALSDSRSTTRACCAATTSLRMGVEE